MNSLNNKKREQVIAALVEGNSIRATSRMTGVAQNTIFKLLAELGTACAEYQDKAFRNLTCKKIQCDEIWSFCYAKTTNVPEEKKGEFGYGDVWTWVSMDADTKLVPCWLVGPRTSDAAHEFIHDLASRLANRVQLTTDAISRILRRSKVRSVVKSTTRCWSRFTELPARKSKRGIALRSASAVRNIGLRASRKAPTFRLAISSGKT